MSSLRSLFLTIRSPNPGRICMSPKGPVSLTTNKVHQLCKNIFRMFQATDYHLTNSKVPIGTPPPPPLGAAAFPFLLSASACCPQRSLQRGWGWFLPVPDLPLPARRKETGPGRQFAPYPLNLFSPVDFPRNLCLFFFGFPCPQASTAFMTKAH